MACDVASAAMLPARMKEAIRFRVIGGSFQRAIEVAIERIAAQYWAGGSLSFVRLATLNVPELIRPSSVAQMVTT